MEIEEDISFKVISLPCTFTVMAIKGQISIAIANMDRLHDRWYLARLVVRPQYRKQGLGRKLISYLKANAGGVPIVVHPGGYDLTKDEQFSFYERCGFTRKSPHALILV